MAVGLSPNMLELLTDVVTHPQMYVGTYGRWGKTARALQTRGLATVKDMEGKQSEVKVTEDGRREAARRGLVPTAATT